MFKQWFYKICTRSVTCTYNLMNLKHMINSTNQYKKVFSFGRMLAIQTCPEHRTYNIARILRMVTGKMYFIHSFILNYLYRVKTFSSYGKKTALQCALLKQKRKNKKKKKLITQINSKFYLIHCQITAPVVLLYHSTTGAECQIPKCPVLGTI